MDQLRSAEAFVGWLNRIAVNVWLEEVRRVVPLTSPDPHIIDVLPDPGPVPERELTGMDLERALTRLNTIERLCITLSYGEGYSHNQIAKLVELPLGTVKSHVLRGSTKLKKILRGNKDDE